MRKKGITATVPAYLPEIELVRAECRDVDFIFSVRREPDIFVWATHAVSFVVTSFWSDLEIVSATGVGELVQAVWIVGIISSVTPGMCRTGDVVFIRHNMEVMRNRRVGELKVSVVKMHGFDYDLAA